MRQDRWLPRWSMSAAAIAVTGTLVVIASHRDRGWSEAGTIVYEFGFVAVLSSLPFLVGLLGLVRPDPDQPPAGWGRRGMGRWQIATMAVIAGGAGLLIGRPLSEHNPTGPVWTSDAAYPLAILLVGLAIWNLVRFAVGRLLVIGLLAAGALQFTIYDVGAAPPVWDRGYAGIELFGIWLFCMSAVLALLGALGALLTERPVRGADTVAPSGQRHPGLPWWRHPGFLVAGGVVALWAVGIVVANVERHQAARAGEEEDRGPLQPEQWVVDPDGAGDGVAVIHMIKTFSPVDESDVDDLGGRLVWAETEIELCDVEIRAAEEGSVQIGNIFPASHGCDGDTQMRDALDDFGMPQTACVFIRSRGVDDEHCAPLTIDYSFEQPGR